MKKILSASLGLAAILNLSVPAYSADLACTCTANAPASGPAGKIVSSQGDVVVSGPASYSPAKAGTPLSANSEVVTNSGSAVVMIGNNCTLDLPPSNSLSVSELGNGQLCVAQNSGAYDAGGASASAAATGGMTPQAWAIVGVAAAVGIGIAIANNNDDDDDDHRDRKPASK